MNYESLVGRINLIQDALQAQAAHAVNLSLTARNWLVGYYIVEFEQHGADRAKYGVMRKARRCLAFLYSIGEDAVEVMTWYDSSAAV